MTQVPPSGRALPHLDDALESAIADLLAGTADHRSSPERAMNGAQDGGAERARSEANALVPIAAALHTAPPLDPARRAALGALLERIAANPDDDLPPGAPAAPPTPAADPTADPTTAPHRNGARPAGAAAVVGLLAILALGGALWRSRGAAGGTDPSAGSTTPPAAAVPGAGPGGAPPSPADAAAAQAATLGASRPASVAGGTDAGAAARATSLLGMPSLGYTSAAATATALHAARSLAVADAGPNAVSQPGGLPGGAANIAAPPVEAAPSEVPPAATSQPKRRATAVQATPVPPTTVPPTTAPAPTIDVSTPAGDPNHPCYALAQPNVLVARILADDGAPIVDAVVTLFLVGQIDFASFGATDARGCVAIEQAPGRYDLRAEAAGFDARWYPGAVDRAAALALEVDGAAARAPVDVRLPRSVAAPPSPTATLPAASFNATPTAAEPTSAASPTAPPPAPATAPADADADADADDLTTIDVATSDVAVRDVTTTDVAAPDLAASDLATNDVAAPDRAATLAGLPLDRQRQLDGLAEFAQDGGTVTAVALDDRIVWGVVGPRVLGWPRDAGGGSTAPVAWTPVLPEVPEAIALDGDRLVVATPGRDGAPATVWIFDIAPTGALGHVAALGACDLTGSGAAEVMALAADDTWIYALTERGLSIVDAKRAAAPFEIGHAAAGTAPTARASGSLTLLGDGTHALLARPSGLQVIDVRAPAAPRVVFQGVPRDVHAVAADGGTVAVAIEAVTGRLAGTGGTLRLTTLDVADPTRPRALAAVALPGGTHAGGTDAGGTLPDGAGSAAGGSRAVTALAGEQAAVVDGDGRSLWIIDLSDPAAPVASGRIALSAAPTGAAALAMDADGTAAVALGAAGIRLLADGLTAPHGVVPPVAQLVLDADGRVGWGAAGAVGIVAVDLDSRPDAAVPGGWLLGSTAATAPDGSAADVHSVLATANTVYALTRRGGLMAFDGTDPRRPTRLAPSDGRLAAIDGGALPVQLAADGGRLYVPDAAGTVHVIDVRRPADPREVGQLAGVGHDDDRLVALAADGTRLYALTTDGRTSRVHALDVGDAAAPRPLGAAAALDQAYRRIAIWGDRLVLSGDRVAPGLGAIDRSLDPATRIEVPGLAAGAVGLIELPGGGRRALVADDAFLTAVDLDALADAHGRISGRSVRLPLGRRAAGGSTDVRIVGDHVYVARHEAGLFARPHGGGWLPQAPSAAPPGSGGPGPLTYRLYLPSVVKGHPTCVLPGRVHGVLLVDGALASFVDQGPPSGAGGELALARFRPGVASWLGGLGVGTRPGTGASIVLWGEQANFVGQGADAGALATAFPGRIVPRPGRRIDLALRSAEQQLGVRAGTASAEIAGRVVLVATVGWPEDVHTKAVTDAARLRTAGWRIEAIALGDDAPIAQLAELTGDATGVARVAALAELPMAMARAGQAAWLCAR